MRRRILIALLGLTAAILVGAVIPLGYQASAHDYATFVEDAQSRTRAATAAAEELLADKLAGPELSRDLTSAARQGDGMIVMAATGAVIARAGPKLHSAAGHAQPRKIDRPSGHGGP